MGGTDDSIIELRNFSVCSLIIVLVFDQMIFKKKTLHIKIIILGLTTFASLEPL